MQEFNRRTMYLLKLLQTFEELFDETFGNWRIDPEYFYLKENVEPICLRPNPVQKVQKNV